VLKGANTSIACPNGNCYFNSTGNPGMATGGSGDVLTGILTGFLAQGYSAFQACILGIYLHGLAGDIASESTQQEALLSSDIINHMGQAFKAIRKN
jgi:NAD(P)H-hydrate epimerase